MPQSPPPAVGAPDNLRLLLRNTGFNTAALTLNRLANTVIVILLSRTVGTAGVGVYSLALSYFLIGSRFAYWGLDHLLTRDVAQDYATSPRYFANFTAIRLVSGLLVCAGMLLITWQMPYAYDTRLAVAVMLLSILPENIINLCGALFMAHERMEYATLAALLNGLLKIVGSVWVVSTGGSVVAISAIFLVANLMTMVFSLAVVGLRFVPVRLGMDIPFWRSQLASAFPLMIVGMIFIMDNRIDLIALSFLTDESSIGLYSAATAILAALAMLPQGIRNAIFPLLARSQTEGNERLGRTYRQVFKYLFLLALPITVGIALVGADVIQLIYTSAFAEAVPVLQVMVWSFIFYTLGVLTTRLMIIHNRQALLARFLMLSLIVNVVLNTLLVPRIGIVGAAVAKVAATALLFWQTRRAAEEMVGRVSVAAMAWQPVAAVAVMAGVVWLLAPLGLWVQIGAGGVTYVVVLLATDTISPEERTLWRAALLRHTPSRR